MACPCLAHLMPFLVISNFLTRFSIYIRRAEIFLFKPDDKMKPSQYISHMIQKINEAELLQTPVHDALYVFLHLMWAAMLLSIPSLSLSVNWCSTSSWVRESPMICGFSFCDSSASSFKIMKYF